MLKFKQKYVSISKLFTIRSISNQTKLANVNVEETGKSFCENKITTSQNHILHGGSIDSNLINVIKIFFFQFFKIQELT